MAANAGVKKKLKKLLSLLIALALEGRVRAGPQGLWPGLGPARICEFRVRGWKAWVPA